VIYYYFWQNNVCDGYIRNERERERERENGDMMGGVI